MANKKVKAQKTKTGISAEFSNYTTKIDAHASQNKQLENDDFTGKVAKFEQCNAVHELFESQVNIGANRIAIEYNGAQLTYGELEARSNQLACYLRANGVTRNSFVALVLDRSIEMFVAIIGIHKAGGAYVPIDYEYPLDRIKLLLEDIEPKALLTLNKFAMSIPNEFSQIALRMDTDWQPKISMQSGNRLAAVNSDLDHAYMIYTSGSTGKPKGCVNSHKNLNNYLQFIKSAHPMGEYDKLLFRTPYTFDVSVPEIIYPLICGSRIYIAEPGRHGDPDYLVKTIIANRITEVGFTPSMLQVLLENPQVVNCSTLKIVTAIGEALPPTTVNKFYDLLPNAKLINSYGPTEAAVAVTYWECSRNHPQPTTPIGPAIPNNKIYILNENGRPVPTGEYGELYIGGIQVCTGYWKRPDLTAERFVKDPFSSEPQSKMYKTGDRARYLTDGNIEYQGRLDFQIKIRGMRVELGEIESAILENRDIVHCAVVVKDKDADRTGRLVAYLVTKNGEHDLLNLNEELRRKLPDYMIPSTFIRLEQLPTITSGKVDRKALADRKDIISDDNPFISPVGKTELDLSAVWGQLLKLKKISRNDNFFNLGGDSIQAAQLSMRIRRQFGVEISLEQIFSMSTLMAQARHIDSQLNSGASSRLQPILKQPRNNPLPLSFAQERLWILNQIEDENNNDAISSLVPINGLINRPALEKAFISVVERHEILRSKFTVIGGRPMQDFLDANLFNMDFEDQYNFTDLNDASFQKIIEKEISKPFDLTAGRLIRAKLYRLSSKQNILLVSMHHIVSDFWSEIIFYRELQYLYEKNVKGEANDLTALEYQYADFAVWQRDLFDKTDTLTDDLKYWQNRLNGTPDRIELPTDHPRPIVKSQLGRRHKVNVEPTTVRDLKQFCDKNNVTLNMAFLALFKILLAKYTGQTDIVVGSPFAGRQGQDVEHLVGLFVNTLVLRTDLGNNPTLSEIVARVKQTTLEANSHANLPFEKLVDALKPVRHVGSTPFFQLMYNYLANTSDQSGKAHDRTFKPQYLYDGTTKFVDLTLEIHMGDDTCVLCWDYATALFSNETIEQMGRHYLKLLTELINNSKQALSDLQMTSIEEENRLLTEFSGAEVQLTKFRAMQELFERQVDSTPNKVALEMDDQKLTYIELDRRANQLARFLRSNGVGQGTFVALIIDRNIEMFISVLATIKAGGAFVPIDPQYPEDRIGFLVNDIQPKFILTAKAFSNAVPESAKEIAIAVDTDWPTSAGKHDTARLNCINSPSDIAYMIYTSGSTGKPKGCLNTHGGLANYILSINHKTPLSQEDKYVFKASVVFDTSIKEIFWPLITGATNIIIPTGEHKDARFLLKTIKARSATFIEFVPSLLQIFLDEEDISDFCQSLKYVTAGGEALRPEVVRRFFKVLPKVKLLNSYGPTETSIAVISGQCDANDELVPIGLPLPNNKIYILDERGRPTPIGVFGELYIAGPQVGRGYWKDPKSTNERFVKDLFAKDKDARMYKTGDRARFMKDGRIEYQGRLDSQIKIRGMRVELGEIESALLEIENISQAAVVLKKLRPEDNTYHLVAYLVANGK